MNKFNINFNIVAITLAILGIIVITANNIVVSSYDYEPQTVIKIKNKDNYMLGYNIDNSNSLDGQVSSMLEQLQKKIDEENKKLTDAGEYSLMVGCYS